MPNYYNPYNSTAVNYGGSVYPNYPAYTQPTQSFAAPQVQMNTIPGMIWVDGEVGAKAFQMHQMGMPNPLQKINYQMDETAQQQTLPVGQSGSMAVPNIDYATKDDLNAMRSDIQAMRQLLEKQSFSGNQNGGNNQQNTQNGNRGGNR